MTCPAGVQIAQGRADNAAVTSVHHPAVGCAALLAFALAAVPAIGQERQPPPEPASLTRLSLEELGDLPVVSVSKTPHEAWATAAAIVVLTADDIRRSGATYVLIAPPLRIPATMALDPPVQALRQALDRSGDQVRVVFEDSQANVHVYQVFRVGSGR